MVFSSLKFLFAFMPLFFAVYYIAPKSWRNTLLFLGSIVFYTAGEEGFRFYTLLLIFSVLINYTIGLHMAAERGKKRKFLLAVGLVYDFGLLLFFKYTDFFLENIGLLADLIGKDITLSPLGLLLPLGISFYTFQITSYLIDVYTEKTEPATSFVSLGAYLCMFPQLSAGPIVEYKEVSAQLKEREYTIEQVEDGFKTFTLGLASKVLLANVIGILWNDIQMVGYESITTQMAWLGAFAYSLQIYFDFWGYSLMAIGLGKMLGFTIPQNFNHPYISRSMSEFWRRWHITLGRWFRQYVYIPLGGSRCGKLKLIRNLFVVWFITGFWHGASWNFVVWGLSFFVLICLERLFLHHILEKSRILSHAYVILLLPLSWILFAVTDFSQIAVYFSRLFPFFGADQPLFLHLEDWKNALETYWPFLAAGVLFATPLPMNWYERYKKHPICIILLVVVFWVCVYRLFTAQNNPFLYFRF